MTDKSGTTSASAVAPASATLTAGIGLLLKEVDEALASDRWVLVDSGTERSAWLAYDAAALRHCCQLLQEIEAGAAAGQELTVGILGRAHLEAWLVALYIHFGEFDAVVRLARDTRHNLEALRRESKEFDDRLATAQKAARRQGRKVAKRNAALAGWNLRNPDQTAKPLQDAPYVPRLTPTGLDLDDAISGFGEYEAQGLSVSEIVDWLTKNAPRLGFGRESFRPMYLFYRTMSTIGSHANMSVLDRYFNQPRKGSFVRITAAPNGSLIDNVRISALYGTAFAAAHVLKARDCAAPAADAIEDWLRPDPTGQAAWSPGATT